MAFGLGTFHTVLLVLLLVVPLFLLVDLGEELEGLSTTVGLSIFVALWATSVYCTFRGLRDANMQPAGNVAFGDLLSSGSVWGMWNGMLFFWVLLDAGFVVLLVQDISSGGAAIVGIFFFAFIGFGVGTVLAAPIGAFVGTVFTALDMALLSIARRLVGVRG